MPPPPSAAAGPRPPRPEAGVARPPERPAAEAAPRPRPAAPRPPVAPRPPAALPPRPPAAMPPRPPAALPPRPPDGPPRSSPPHTALAARCACLSASARVMHEATSSRSSALRASLLGSERMPSSTRSAPSSYKRIGSCADAPSCPVVYRLPCSTASLSVATPRSVLGVAGGGAGVARGVNSLRPASHMRRRRALAFFASFWRSLQGDFSGRRALYVPTRYSETHSCKNTPPLKPQARQQVHFTLEVSRIALSPPQPPLRLSCRRRRRRRRRAAAAAAPPPSRTRCSRRSDAERDQMQKEPWQSEGTLTSAVCL